MELFKKLPLVKFKMRGDELAFEPSTNENQGITIIDRVNITKAGETTENQYSCIRMSSNLFLSSGYYYSQICSLSVPFDIRDMAEIS